LTTFNYYAIITLLEKESLNQILIVGITPYFLDKEVFWFQENLQDILKARNTQILFQDNIIYLEKKRSYDLYQLLRKLDEMGYEKVFKVQDPGEFSQIGGVIDVFPINTMAAIRLDFLGNEIEEIKLLAIKIDDEKNFFRIVKACFAGKRKQIHNTLRNNLLLEKNQVKQILASLKINPAARPQELKIEDWIKLVDRISNYSNF